MKKEQKTNFGLKYINNIMKKIPFKPSTTPVTAKHSRKTSKEKKKNTCFNSNVSKAKQPQTKSLTKIKNISSLVLTPNSLIENSAELLLYRKQIILSLLLKNFRKTNYLHVDSFINFSLNNYREFLEEILDMIVGLFLTNSTSIEYLNFIIRNIFEDV